MTDAEFSTDDLATLASRGIAESEARRQLALLRQRPPAVRLDRPCTLGDGIVSLSPDEHEALIDEARGAAATGRVTKFVPASGAATRMFKDLVAALDHPERPSASPAGRAFFDRFDQFPFARNARLQAVRPATIATADDERRTLRVLLDELDYANLPKAFIPFHRHGHVVRTPLAEHLLEGAAYTATSAGTAHTHLTVAPEYRAAFEAEVAALARTVKDVTGITPVVSYSEQHPSTDTIALTANGQPFRAANGALLFRPAGHGALIENLQALAGDVVVIKNIDNVVPYEASTVVVRWKRLLIGHLVRLQRQLEIDRPLRVCGVVRNAGEPGGAPFWVRGRDGELSLQIVESSQVDLSDPDQRRIFESSTHFNPVDVVCALRHLAGRSFDLSRFVDPTAVFLSTKSYEGRELTALERPGLWNGAMAGWHTVFVEVPAETFAPVKTVFDLLRPEHQ